MELHIVHIYPDLLNLYGDRGNVLCLMRRMEWRGMEARVTPIAAGGDQSLSGADLIFIGGGQDFEQEVLLEDLRRGLDRELTAAIDDGVPVLAICGGYQMLGQYYETHQGRRCDFIGALDLHTVGAKERMTGNYKFRLGDDLGGAEILGFENHSGRTYLGPGLRPLGTVISGFGNNGEDGTEGVHEKNVFGTYGHGPLLPKNPFLADLLLKTALERKYGTAELQPLDDRLEQAAHREMSLRIC